jgi:hypothetical protein
VVFSGHAAQQGYFDGSNPVKLAEIPAFAPNGMETKPYSLEEIVAMLKVLPELPATASQLPLSRGYVSESYAVSRGSPMSLHRTKTH